MLCLVTTLLTVTEKWNECKVKSVYTMGGDFSKCVPTVSPMLPI